jgi:hypothetical protein
MTGGTILALAALGCVFGLVDGRIERDAPPA